MGLFNASNARPERSEADIKREQTRAKLDDANQSTRLNEITLAELRKLRVL